MASKPCLPVSKRRKSRDNETICFDDIDSLDATQYLRMVVQQSNRLPEILVSPEPTPRPTTTTLHQPPSSSSSSKGKKEKFVPIEGSAASLSYLISDRTAILPPPSPNYLPQHCKAWVDQTLANFSQLRMYLEKLHLQTSNGGKRKIERKQAVPAMKDRTGWHIFCLGTEEARGNAGSYFGPDDDDDKDDEEMPNNEEEEEVDEEATNKADTTKTTTEENRNNDLWRKDLPEKGYSPTTSLILQLDQVMVRRVIAHLAHYVEEGWSCSEQRCQWLYSLLARLEKPVHRNDLAVLFGLLKALTRARKTTLPNSERKGLARLNVLITIIGIYYEQGGGYAGVMAVKS